MQSTQSPEVQELDLTSEDLEILIQALGSGATIADVTNMQPEALEGLYTLAYNMYQAGNFDNAETLFRTMCLYKHNDRRFWLGLAGTLQAQERYKEAIDAYSMVGLCTSLKDPAPMFFTAQCLLKMGDKEHAIDMLEAALFLCSEATPEHVTYKTTAQELLHMLRNKKQGA
ncbi:MAG: SycD/LcrH family type III secretion system chaperone [Bilophila sp.]